MWLTVVEPFAKQGLLYVHPGEGLGKSVPSCLDDIVGPPAAL